MKKTIFGIGLFTTIYSIIVVIFLIGEVNTKTLAVGTFLGLLLAIIVNNILLWALFVALDRIDELKHDVDKLKYKQKQQDISQEAEESSSDYKECELCGYATITQDEVCPKCGHPYEKIPTDDDSVDQEIDGIEYCKKCGYQIFPEYTKCPNCQEPIKKKED